MRELRIRAGLTQKDVAARLGVDQVAVSHWELGKHYPRERKVQALARLYGCSAADILNAVEIKRSEY